MTDRDRLIELHHEAGVEWDNYLFECIDNDKIPSKTYDEFHADYLLANGVIVPKFNVGDKVWYITGIHRTLVKSAIVEEIIINCDGVSDLFVTSDTGSFENSVDIFYNTKEEAEKALEGYKENP